MKIFICLAALAAVAASSPALRLRRGVIHDHHHESGGGGDSVGASAFHHEIEHEHAKSHQSVKFEHFHPVPVYVKKEHAHLLKHPLEKGKSEHGVKLLHPKHEHHHGYGLVLEEHRSDLHEQPHHYGGGFDKIDEAVGADEGGSSFGELAHFAHEGTEQVASYEPTKALQQHDDHEAHFEYRPVEFEQHDDGYAAYH